MEKVTKKALIERVNEQELRIYRIEKALKQSGIKWVTDEPKLKQLYQSVFDGLDPKWRFAAVNADGFAGLFKDQPYVIKKEWAASYTLHQNLGDNFDTTDWQNSLIERDLAKELLEVDLSSELTGSELCKAMLERGDRVVMCQCWDSSYADIEQVVDVINGFECTAYKSLFVGSRHSWEYAVPVNNQGEPLTASEAGL